MRVSSLAVAFALTATAGLTACDPGTSLRGEALTGFVNDTIIDGEVTHDVAFFFDELTTDTDDCPWLPAGSVTFDGEVVAEETGGLSTGFLTGSSCNGVILGFALDDSETRDGLLAITSGEDTVRYVGENLVANRRFVADDGVTVAPGGALRFHYAPSTDITSLPQAWLRDNAENNSFELFANRSDNGDIVVIFPLDAPTGRQTLNFRYDLAIPTVTCEGFSSCTVTGQHFEQVFITVQEAG